MFRATDEARSRSLSLRNPVCTNPTAFYQDWPKGFSELFPISGLLKGKSFHDI